MSDVKISALPLTTNLSGPEVFPIVQSGTTKQTSLSVGLQSFLSPLYVPITGQGRFSPGGRLTIDSGDPVPNRDFAAQSTLYYTPFRHNNIFTFSGSVWGRVTFSEISLALSGLTTGKNYDVFVDKNALNLSLSSAWASDTSRTDALGTQDGTPVSGLDNTKLWLGTIRASSATTTEDTGGGTSSQVGGQRFVWNAYNQAPRFISVIDTTATWTYSTATIRQANAATGNKVEYVSGENATMLEVGIISTAVVTNGSAREATVGVGIDSITAFSGLVGAAFNTTANSPDFMLAPRYTGFPGQGYHYLSWNESGSDGTCVFVGNVRNVQSGLQARLLN